MSRRAWLRAARVGFAVAVLAAVGFALADQWSEVGQRLRQLSPLAAVLAFVDTFAALAASMLSWRAVVADLGSPLPVSVAARILFVGQLGKYLPGSVWPVVAQMELGKAAGVPRTRSATAFAVWTGIGLVTGTVVGAVAAPALVDAHGAVVLLGLLVLPVGALLLWPRVLNPLVGRGLRLLRRDPLEHPLSGRGVLAAAGWYVVAWLLFGAQAAVLVHDFGGGDVTVSALAVGGFAVATVTGLLAVPVPAGAGVREAVFVAVLATAVPTAAATAAAIVSRLVVTIADVLVAAAAARRTRPPDGSDGAAGVG